jgi:hypothetical protein
MDGPNQQPVAAGSCARHRPRAAAIRVTGLILLPIAAILAAIPSVLAMIIGLNLLILGRLGIG